MPVMVRGSHGRGLPPRARQPMQCWWTVVSILRVAQENLPHVTFKNVSESWPFRARLLSCHRTTSTKVQVHTSDEACGLWMVPTVMREQAGAHFASPLSSRPTGYARTSLMCPGTYIGTSDSIAAREAPAFDVLQAPSPPQLPRRRIKCDHTAGRTDVHYRRRRCALVSWQSRLYI